MHYVMHGYDPISNTVIDFTYETLSGLMKAICAGVEGVGRGDVMQVTITLRD